MKTLLKKAQENTYNAELDIEIPKTLRLVLEELKKKGKRGLVVGGAVRDAVMGFAPKDLDVEIYGLNYEDLYNFLSPFDRKRKPDVVGKSFGIIKITDNEGNEYDFSIPRRESRTGVGHTNFKVEFDKGITPKEAAARRDFTINSLSYDPLSNEIHDYFGGVEDIQNKILRATSPAFAEDPLRVLRGMQFAGRFDLQMDDHTAEMCRGIMSEYDSLSKERVREEWVKFFKKSEHPARGLEVLVKTGWIELYPELYDMLGGNNKEELENLEILQEIQSENYPGLSGYREIVQEPEWHPEGGVFIHTMYVLEAAAKIAKENNLSPDDKMILMMAALGHDMGKAARIEGKEDFITQRTTDKNGNPRITSKGHEPASAPLVENFLLSIGFKQNKGGPETGGNLIFNKVKNLAANHMSRLNYQDGKKDIAHFAEELFPATVEELERLILSDVRGRPPLPGDMPENGQTMIEDAKARGVYRGILPQIFTGGDVFPLFPPKERAKLSLIENHIRQLQLSNKVSSKEEAISAAVDYLKKDIQVIDGHYLINELGIAPGPIVGEILSTIWEEQKRRIINQMSQELDRWNMERQSNKKANINIINPKEVYPLSEVIEDIKSSGLISGDENRQANIDNNIKISKKTPVEKVNFYSKLEIELDKKLPEKLPLSELENIINSPRFQVSKDEIYWSGLLDFINYKKKTFGGKIVSKKEIMQAISEEGLKLNDIIDVDEPELENDLNWGNWDKPELEIDYEYADKDIEERFYGEHEDEYLEEFPEEREGWDNLDFESKKEAVVSWGKDKGIYNSYYQSLIDGYTTHSVSEYQYGYKAIADAHENYWTLLDPEGNVVETDIEYPNWVQLSAQGDALAKYSVENKQSQYKQYALKGGDDYTELLIEWDRGSFGHKGYKSPHWEGKESILAHIRYDERKDIEGNDILFVQEIQSDWHQEGREYGYKEEHEDFINSLIARKKEFLNFILPEIEKVKSSLGFDPFNFLLVSTTISRGRAIPNFEKELHKLYYLLGDINIPDSKYNFDEETLTDLMQKWKNGQYKEIYVKMMYYDSPEIFKYLLKLIAHEKFGEDYIKSLRIDVRDYKNDISSAPEKAPMSNTSDWVSFSLKKAIQIGAEKGMDGIAWSTGKIQNKIYDFSDKIDKLYLYYDGDPDDSETSVGIIAMKDGETILNHGNVPNTEKKIKSILGPELYTRIIQKPIQDPKDLEISKRPPTRGKPYRAIEEELSFDNEGMFKFYDHIVKNIANKIAKKFKTKVQTTIISDNSIFYKIIPTEENGKTKYNVIYNRKPTTVLNAFFSIEDAKQYIKTQSPRNANFYEVHYLPFSDEMLNSIAQEGLAYYGESRKIFKKANKDLNAPSNEIVRKIYKVFKQIDTELSIDKDIIKKLSENFFISLVCGSKNVIITGYYDEEDNIFMFLDEDDPWIFINFYYLWDLSCREKNLDKNSIKEYLLKLIKRSLSNVKKSWYRSLKKSASVEFFDIDFDYDYYRKPGGYVLRTFAEGDNQPIWHFVPDELIDRDDSGIISFRPSSLLALKEKRNKRIDFLKKNTNKNVSNKKENAEEKPADKQLDFAEGLSGRKPFDWYLESKNKLSIKTSQKAENAPNYILIPQVNVDGEPYGYLMRGDYQGESFTTFVYLNEVSSAGISDSALERFAEEFNKAKNKVDFENSGGNVPDPKKMTESKIRENWYKKAQDIFGIDQVIFNPQTGLGSVSDNSNVDYLGFVRYMTPEEFLSLVPPVSYSENSLKKIEEAARSGRGLGNPFLSGIYDEVENTIKVRSHEGRHRMEFIRRVDPKAKIPVHIFLDRGMRRHHLDEAGVDVEKIRLLPQDY